MDKRATVYPDRKLGSAWYGWDGDIQNHEGSLRESPLLYFILLIISLFVLSLALTGASWAIWLASDSAVLAALAGLSGLVILWVPTGICLMAVYLRIPFLAFPWLAKLLTMPVRVFAALYGPFGISRDRISSSCIAINNVVTRLRLKDRAQARPMVLLPRCLSKETFQQIKEVSASFQCPVFFAANNAQAREKVREYKPTSIVAVACERDLVRGLYDYGRHIPILVIPNQRPNGPCVASTIDMDALRRALADVVEKQ